MPECDGFGVIDQLDPAHSPRIIFVTAHRDYALEAFDVHATDYLLKPFDRSRFQRALARVRRDLGRPVAADSIPELPPPSFARPDASRLVVRDGSRILLVPLESIESIEAAGNYAQVHHEGGCHLMRETIANLERQLASRAFARVHRSTIVRIDAVTQLEPLGSGDYAIRTHGGRRLTLSRTHRRSFERAIGRSL